MKKAQAISVYCYYISLTKYLTSVRENIKNSVNINESKTVRRSDFLLKFLENPRYFEYNLCRA